MAEHDEAGKQAAQSAATTLKATAKGVAKQAEKVGESAAQIKESTAAVERSAVELTDSADRRTVLAADRTVLASERTYAAWIRTGMVALASGIGAHALISQQMPRWLVLFTTASMISFSVFCYMSAVWRQLQQVRVPKPDTPRLPSVALVTFSVLLSLVSVATLVVIVFGEV